MHLSTWLIWGYVFFLGILWPSSRVHECCEAKLWGKSSCTGGYKFYAWFMRWTYIHFLNYSVWFLQMISAVWRFCKPQCFWATCKIWNNSSRIQWRYTGTILHKIWHLFVEVFCVLIINIFLSQGTASVVLAGVVAALKLIGGTLGDHTFLFLGAGEVRHQFFPTFLT